MTKQSKVVLTYRPASFHGEPKDVPYIVTKLTNRTEPTIGKAMSKRQVDDMMLEKNLTVDIIS